MAHRGTTIVMPGVAKGKEVIGIPVGDEISAEQKVTGLLEGSMGADVYGGWGASLLHDNLTLISASKPGRTVFKFTVQNEHCNRLGNLHGGCAATLFDICTTTALAPIAEEGFWAFAGVTRTLSVTYIRPIPVGETVVIESEVVHAGKRLCTMKGQMKRERDGAVLTTCEHGKVSIDPPVAAKL